MGQNSRIQVGMGRGVERVKERLTSLTLLTWKLEQSNNLEESGNVLSYKLVACTEKVSSVEKSECC